MASPKTEKECLWSPFLTQWQISNSPPPFPLERCVLDLIQPEEEVDEKYYLTKQRVKSIIDHCDRKQSEGCGFRPDFNEGGVVVTPY